MGEVVVSLAHFIVLLKNIALKKVALHKFENLFVVQCTYSTSDHNKQQVKKANEDKLVEE